MRTLAMYLPQFHRVKENDEWWGKGYTEWTAVKAAEQLFDGHNTVKHPLGDNYYDLMQKETMVWQADLMHRYGIDAMCMYHYWFKNGRKILEKPAENLLQWTDINMPFCFCWANETWARSWSKISAFNTWNNKIENQEKDANKNGVLLEQKYGYEHDWEEHFYYLLPFFCDDRYVKLDGKPVFMIYKPLDVYCLADMIDMWNSLAKKVGFQGVYFIGGTNDGWYSDALDAGVFWQKGSNLTNVQKIIENVRCYDYEGVCKEALSRTKLKNKKLYYKIETGYDDTPRRGKGGSIYVDGSADIFGKYYAKMLAKSKAQNNEFIFINAWNEWGEGMVLEPSVGSGYDYLEAVKKAQEEASDIEIPETFDVRYEDDLIRTINDMKKYQAYFSGLNRWMELRNAGISLVDYMYRKGWKKIAVYGYNEMCRHLLYALENDKRVECLGVIDVAGDKLKTMYPMYSLEDDALDVDIVVVAVYPYYKAVKSDLLKIGYTNIKSLEHIIMEIEAL